MHIDHLNRIDMNLLLTLHVLLEERSVTLAAERLGRHPTTVSHALARLRETLDDPILVRAGRDMVPSTKAASWSASLGHSLEALDGLLQADDVADPATAVRTFRLWISDYVQAVLMPTLSRELRQQAPGLTLHLRGVGPPAVEALRNGDTDMILLTGTLAAPDVLTASVFTDTFECLMDPAHPLAEGPLTLEGFCAAPHALVAPMGTPGGFVDRLLEARGARRDVVVVLPSFLGVEGVIGGTDLLLTAPMRLAATLARHGGLVRRPLPMPSPVVEMKLAWHRRSDGDPIHRWLRERILQAGVV
jgi:DNA-binding transcriptional LysR family regulator